MTNFDLSQKVFDFLRQASVKTVVVCAGARNAPLVAALENSDFEIIHFFEERSASFYALGRMKNELRPVAIMTTSGTAVAELLPAAIESTYQGLPFILITADRPKSYRNSGAPQSIEQPGLFSTYVEASFDLDVETKSLELTWSFKKPIHLNVCFDEPLIDKPSGAVMPVRLTRTQPSTQNRSEIKINRPLVIVGEISASQKQEVTEFLNRSKVVFYAEALSQMQSSDGLLDSAFIKPAFKEKLFDSVVRIGGVPTLRFWRDLESEMAAVPVYNFSELPYSGLARESQTFPFAELKTVSVILSESGRSWIHKKDQQFHAEKSNLLKKYPFSEPACVRRLSEVVNESPLYLGNSLPIRHWDSFAVRNSKMIYANRGANGIDGQVSTYLGWSEKLPTSFCLIGDLTALYDLASLGLTNQLQKNRRHVVVLNNFGGQIFQRVFKNDLFINPHQVQFQHWANMWNWDYRLIKNDADLESFTHELALNAVIEIQPDAEQTKLFWEEWDQLCQRI